MREDGRVAVTHLIDQSGATRYFQSIVRHHDRSRYVLAIGSLEPPGPLQEMLAGAGLHTFSVGVRGRRRYPLGVPALVRELRRHRPDIVHLHTFYASVVGLMAARLARVPSVVVTRHHSDHLLRLNRPAHHALDRMVTAGADAVIAVSEATRAIMVERERAAAAKIRVVHNGIEDIPPRDPRILERLREEMALGGGPVVAMVARLHEEKGHPFLLRALARIRPAFPGLRLLLVGEGEERARLQADVEGLGLADAVRFLGYRADVYDVMALADVLVLPSLAESFGFVLAEAMALGVPVVATDTGGAPEVVGEAGVIVPKGDAQALADALATLLGDPGARSRLAAEGPGRVHRLFRALDMVRGYEAVYEQVLRGRAGRP